MAPGVGWGVQDGSRWCSERWVVPDGAMFCQVALGGIKLKLKLKLVVRKENIACSHVVGHRFWS